MSNEWLQPQQNPPMQHPFFTPGSKDIHPLWQRWLQGLTRWDNYTLTRILGTENQVIVTDNQDGTITLSLPQNIHIDANVVFATLTLDNTGLHLLDTNASHDLIIVPGSDLTADRTLSLVTGDAARIITLQGNPTLSDWFDQAVKIVSSPTHVGMTLSGLTASQMVKTDGSKALTSTIGTVQIPICLDYFDATPSRASESNWHGGILSLATGQPLDSVPTDLPVTKGIGKVMVVINAGSDLSGEITVTGTSVDRETGATTPADTDTISVDALTTDGSTTDSNGNTVHTFTGAYITSKWFTGSVTLSTADLTLTDVDVYHVSFEQVNDSPNLVLNTFDANIFTTSVNAEFDAYLYTLHVTGDKCDIHNEAGLHVGADGETSIADRYWRLRRGNIDDDLDGTTDGFWVDFHYSNTPVDVEDVTASVWLTRTITVEMS